MSAGLIFQQIPKIMAELDAIGKERRNNQGSGFNYRGIDDIYNELHARLAKHKVFTVPEVVEERREYREAKSGGNLTYVIAKIKYTFYAEDGSSVSATMIGEAMDSGDKASNKAQSVAHKYCFIQVFAIPTSDDKDPDATTHEILPVKTLQNHAITPRGPSASDLAEDPGLYVPKIGRLQGKALREHGAPDVNDYISKLKYALKKDNKPAGPEMIEVIEWCEAYLKTSEFKRA